MLGISITDEDKEKARTGRFEQPDIHVQKSLHLLYFKALGYAHIDLKYHRCVARRWVR
jgi:hypothetical protein